MSEELGSIRGQILLDISNAMAGLTQLRQEHLSTFSAMGQAAGTLDTISTGFINYGKSVFGAIRDASVAFGEFERKLDYLSVVADASDKEVAALGAQIRQLGADTIYTNDEIAVGFTELAKAGVSASDILDGIGEGITYLGAAADIGLGEAATMMMSVVQTWGMAATEAGRVADVLAGTANSSMVEIDDLGVSMKYAGSVASSLGISFDEVSTALGLLGKRAIRGSTAGTSLRQIMIGLTGNTEKATREMERLGIITEEGSNRFFDQNGKVKSLADAMQVLRDATAGMGEEQRIASLKTMFNVRSLPSLLTLLDAGTEGFNEMTDAIQGVAAADVAGARLDNLSGDIELLMGEIDNLILSFGELTSGALRPLIQMLEGAVAWFNGLSDEMKGTIVTIATITAGLALLVGGILKVGSMALTATAQIGLLKIAFEGLTWSAIKANVAMQRAMILGGIGILIAALGVLVTLMVQWFQTTEEGQAAWASISSAISNFMSSVGTPLMNFFSQLITAAGPVLTTILTTLASILTGVGAGMSGAAGGVGSLLSSGLAVVAQLFSTVGQVLMNLIMPIITALAPVFEQFAAALAGVSTNMTGMAGAADIFAQILVAVIDMAAQLVVVFIELGTQLLITVIGMLPMLIEAFTTLLITIIEVVVGMLPTLIEAFINGLMTLIDAVVTMIPMIIQAAIQLVTALINALVTALPLLIQAGIQLLTGLITAITQAIPLIVTALVTAIPQIIQAVVGAIPMLIQAGIQLFISLVQALAIIIPQVITALLEAIPLILNALIEAIPLILEAAIQAFMSLVEAIPVIIPQLITAIIELIPVIIETLIGLIPVLIDAALQLFLGIVQAIPMIISNLIPAIIGLLPTIIETLISLIPQLIEAAIELFMAIVKAIPQIVTAIVEALWKLGEDMINGLIDGLVEMGPKVLDAIGGIVDGAIGWAKDLLGIASPSKVFREIGEFVGEGMALGIEDSEKMVSKAIDYLLSGTKDSFSELVDQRQAALTKLAELEKKAATDPKNREAALRDIAKQKALITELNATVIKQGLAIVGMQGNNQKYLAVIKERDLIVAKMAAAQKKLNDLESGSVSHFGTFLDNMDKAITVTNKSTVDGMIYAVETQIEKVQEFNSLIADLQSRGLDQASLNELITEFMSSGSMVSARALAESSDDAIAQLGDLRKQLGVEAAKTAVTTGDIMYDSGIEAARGLVNGLQSQLNEINGAAATIANTLVTAVKKELGIRSPSKVTAEIGNEVMGGLILGIVREKDLLDRELNSVANQIAQFNDDVLAAKQFELETVLTLRANDQASLSIGQSSNRELVDAVNRLISKLDEVDMDSGPTESFTFGDIMFSIDDLRSIKTLEEFMDMLRVYKRQRGGR